MNQRHSLIIALGAGLAHQKPGDPPYLWIGDETKLRAAAAAKLWKQDLNALLLFSGGRAPGTPSEAETMESYVQREPWNVPADHILTENDSIDTASNVRNVVQIIHEQRLPTDSIILIAGISNLTRAARYFRAYGLRVTPYLAHDVLGSDIEKYGLPIVSQTMTLKARFKSILALLEQIIDPKGVLVTWLKKWQESR